MRTKEAIRSYPHGRAENMQRTMKPIGDQDFMEHISNLSGALAPMDFYDHRSRVYPEDRLLRKLGSFSMKNLRDAKATARGLIYSMTTIFTA